MTRLSRELTISVSLPEDVSSEELSSNLKKVILGYSPQAKITTNLSQRLKWSQGFLRNEAGYEVPLTEMERVILSRLANEANRFVSYNDISGHLLFKTGKSVTPANLRVIMHRLRKKLGSDCIQTERDGGYSVRTGQKLEVQ